MNVEQTIEHLRNQGLTYCGRPGKLEKVHHLTRHIEATNIPGIMLEAGVAMGGSASIIIKSKRADRELRLYDVFEMLPAPSADDDAKSHQAYQYFLAGKGSNATDKNYLAHSEDLLSFTQDNMRSVGIDIELSCVKFIKGLYEQTLHINEPVAFAHIDCDWYESVRLCIERIAHHMSLGGIFLFDDYHSFSGCKKAVDAWLLSDVRYRILHADWTVAVQRVA